MTLCVILSLPKDDKFTSHSWFGKLTMTRMIKLTMITQLTPKDYAKFGTDLPLWQSLTWKEYQEALGRKTRLYGLKNANGDIEATALIIIDSTAFGLTTWEIPRGPIGTSDEAILDLLKGIIGEAKNERCIIIYHSPLRQSSRPNIRIFEYSNIRSKRHIHPQTTLTIDLTATDEEILSEMKQKGRYNIRVAQKHGVTVKQSDDIDAFYKLLTKTGKRDTFGIHSKHHYENFLKILSNSFLLLAYQKPDNELTSKRVNDSPIASVLGTIWNQTGYYYYGASDHAHRNLMAPYLLQWEAMKLCRERGCKTYDFLGISPNESSDHPWSGITQFKKQFGGTIVNSPPEQMIVLKPMMKRLIDLKRKFMG